jgi:hypothetical protein
VTMGKIPGRRATKYRSRRLRWSGSSAQKTSLYAIVLSQILVSRLFTPFSVAAKVAKEDEDGRCSDEAQVSPRVELLFFFLQSSLCKFV